LLSSRWRRGPQFAGDGSEADRASWIRSRAALAAVWRKPWTARARVVREPLKRTVLDPERGARRRKNNEDQFREPAPHGRRPCPVAARRPSGRGTGASGGVGPRCPRSATRCAAHAAHPGFRPL